jgi:hypothetical protein
MGKDRLSITDSIVWHEPSVEVEDSSQGLVDARFHPILEEDVLDLLSFRRFSSAKSI